MHIDDGPGWRGGQRQVLLLVRGLLSRGHEVGLVCRPGDVLAVKAREVGATIFEMAIRGEWDALAAWRLGALAEDWDIIHAHTSHSHAIALMAVRIGVMKPVIVHRRVDFEISKGPFSKWKYRVPDRFIAISNAVAEVLKNGGVRESKITVVNSGIDPESVEAAPVTDPRKILRLEPGTPIVGNVAQLVDHKGHRYLIDATPALLKAVPGAHVLIIGSGPLEQELRDRIRALDLVDRVHLLGWRDDAINIMKSFDVFAMPSHLEGMGTSVLDAFAAGVPVVSTDAGGLVEMVRDGFTGRVVPARDSKALAEALVKSLTEEDRSRRMAQEARKLLHERFSADSMVEGVLGVYGQLIN